MPIKLGLTNCIPSVIQLFSYSGCLLSKQELLQSAFELLCKHHRSGYNDPLLCSPSVQMCVGGRPLVVQTWQQW